MMVAARKSLRASLVATLALTLRAGLSDACSCLAREYCVITEDTDIIVSGPITGRNSETMSPFFGMNTYTMTVTDMYKMDMDMLVADELTFESPTSSAACGVELEVGEDYVVGLTISEEGTLYAYLCGPTQKVDSITSEQLAVLENGGSCIRQCGDTVCAYDEECIMGQDGKMCVGKSDDGDFSYDYTVLMEDPWFP